MNISKYSVLLMYARHNSFYPWLFETWLNKCFQNIITFFKRSAFNEALCNRIIQIHSHNMWDRFRYLNFQYIWHKNLVFICIEQGILSGICLLHSQNQYKILLAICLQLTIIIMSFVDKESSIYLYKDGWLQLTGTKGCNFGFIVLTKVFTKYSWKRNLL